MTMICSTAPCGGRTPARRRSRIGHAQKGARADQARRQQQGMDQRRRTRNAVEPRQREQHEAGHEFGQQHRFRHVQGIVNREQMASFPRGCGRSESRSAMRSKAMPQNSAAVDQSVVGTAARRASTKPATARAKAQTRSKTEKRIANDPRDAGDGMRIQANFRVRVLNSTWVQVRVVTRPTPRAVGL